MRVCIGICGSVAVAVVERCIELTSFLLVLLSSSRYVPTRLGHKQYEQGGSLVDKTCQTMARHIGRIVGWYTNSGFHDDCGHWHYSGYKYVEEKRSEEERRGAKTSEEAYLLCVYGILCGSRCGVCVCVLCVLLTSHYICFPLLLPLLLSSLPLLSSSGTCGTAFRS